METREISVAAPWGHIAAKTWGSGNRRKLLAIHGLNDNAGSFDQLMPLLHDQLFIVCVDLPGHGLSSHFPPGIHFSLLDFACATKLVVDHLQWTHFDVLSHSVGSSVAVYFTALFGENVSHLILIDGFFPVVIPDENFVQERCQVILDKFLNSVKTNGKVYSYDESIEKLNEERTKHIGRRALEALQKRAFTECDHGYVFNNDKRVKLVVYSLFMASFHFGLMKCLKCQLLIIKTSDFEASSLSKTPTNLDTLTLMHQSLGSKLMTVQIQGSHDVHMESPQVVAPLIKRFLFHCISHL